MSKKSSSKKKKCLWSYCDKCENYFPLQLIENHNEDCKLDDSLKKYSYIRNKKLYTTEFDKKLKSDEFNGISNRLFDNLVFISEEVLRLCDACIGERVIIFFPEDSGLAPIVKQAWPIPDKFLTTVFFSSKEYTLNWQTFRGQRICISKLDTEVFLADELSLRLNGKYNLEPVAFQNVIKLLKVQLKELVFCVGNCVFLNFFNKELIFTVEHLKSNLENIEQKFENLKFSDIPKHNFYVISHDCKMKLTSSVEYEIYRSHFEAYPSYADIGGLEDALDLAKECIKNCFENNQTMDKISHGLLIFGPAGCGKSMLCSVIANEFRATALIIKINTSAIFSRYFGETEKNLQNYFQQAFSVYPQPCLVIVEDVNNICPRWESNDLLKRISAAFLTLLDSIESSEKAQKTFILATTTNIENLNPAARRCGRLDTELEINVPQPKNRLEILQTLLRSHFHQIEDNELQKIADTTHGFVGADLANLISKATYIASKKKVKLNISSINEALVLVKPSAMREVAIENPNVKWEDIGGQSDLKLKLKQAIEWPLQHPEKFKKLGIKPPRGLLMFGPPGCSKTMIAKALATESKLNFISIKGPELFSMWVGESERAVREVFRKARQVAPSIIFFDEIDAISGERSSENGSSVKERVLAQILTEIDGVDALPNVTVVAATNRPDMIDKALLRPGRIDRIVYVGLPCLDTRREIFKIKLKNMPISDDVDIEALIAKTEGYSGAEIQAVCHEAALKALEENLDTEIITQHNFEYSLGIVKPRTSQQLLNLYENYLKESKLKI